MKFKHHLNEQKHGSLHFSVTSVGNTRLFFLSADSALRQFFPPFTLFTDYLTIQVLNKNEVRKWFEDYRSCRTCWTATHFFVKEQVTKKKKKRINECAFKNNWFTQLLHLWLQSRLNDFTAFPPSDPLPQGKFWGENVREGVWQL